MRIADELKMSLKGLFSRPLETGFLILGIALGIGATATGLSLFLHTVKVGQDIASLPQYREIIVKPGIDRASAEAPAVLVEGATRVNFSSEDLKALADIPSATHAYLVQNTEYRLGNVPMGGQGFPGGQDQARATETRQGGTQTSVAGSGAVSAARTGSFPSTGTGAASSSGSSTGGAASAAGSGGSSSGSTSAGSAGSTGASGNTVAGGPGPGDGPGMAFAFGGFEGGPPPEVQGGTTGGGAQGAAPSPPADMPAELRAEMEAMRSEMQSMFSGDVTVSDPEPTLTELPGRMVSPSYFEAMGLHAAQGSLFTEAEAQKRSRVLVLGASIAEKLYDDGKPMGRQIIMNRQIYTIVGILVPTGTDLDNYGYTPLFRTAVFGRSSQTEVHFMVADPSKLPEAEAQITLWFTQKHGVISVNAPREAAEQANSRNSRLAIIILFLAGSGFFIAAVNVSNILLSRTIRQFRSIGILKALGASKADIFRLYFMESGFLALGGMVAGIGLSVLLSGFLSSQLGGEAMSTLGIVLGVAASTVITMLITLYPSFQASKVPAAQAVKME